MIKKLGPRDQRKLWRLRIWMLFMAFVLSGSSIVSMVFESDIGHEKVIYLHVLQILVTIGVPLTYLYSIFGRRSYIHHSIRTVFLLASGTFMVFIAFISQSNAGGNDRCHSECIFGGPYNGVFIIICFIFVIFVTVESCWTSNFKAEANRQGFKNIDVNVSIVEADNTVVPLDQYSVTVDQPKQ